MLNEIVNEAGLPIAASKLRKLAVLQDLVLVCYGSASHLDNKMSCFVSHNDASTRIWPVQSMDLNTARVFVIMGDFTLTSGDLKYWFVETLDVMRKEIFSVYLHSSTSHQSISLCLSSSHGIKANSSASLLSFKDKEINMLKK